VVGNTVLQLTELATRLSMVAAVIYGRYVLISEQVTRNN
jgi:hypothetical protein